MWCDWVCIHCSGVKTSVFIPLIFLKFPLGTGYCRSAISAMIINVLDRQTADKPTYWSSCVNEINFYQWKVQFFIVCLRKFVLKSRLSQSCFTEYHILGTYVDCFLYNKICFNYFINVHPVLFNLTHSFLYVNQQLMYTD